jgi:hypothetical protein
MAWFLREQDVSVSRRSGASKALAPPAATYFS